MRWNSNMTLAASVAVVSALALALALAHQTRLRLAEQHQNLELQLEQMAALRARTQERSNQLAQSTAPLPAAAEDQSLELLRLRGEVGRLRRQNQELARAPKEPASASPEASRADSATNVATADYWPQNSWHFAGFATPEAALQTSLWAANNGDLQSLAASFTGDMQKEVEKELQGKSEAEMKARALDEVIGFQSVRILDRQTPADDTAVVTFAIETRAGTQPQKMLLRRIDNQWKVAGPAP